MVVVRMRAFEDSKKKNELFSENRAPEKKSCVGVHKLGAKCVPLAEIDQ